MAEGKKQRGLGDVGHNVGQDNFDKIVNRNNNGDGLGQSSSDAPDFMPADYSDSKDNSTPTDHSIGGVADAYCALRSASILDYPA